MNTKNSGNSPCTASPEPVRSAATHPSAPNPVAASEPSAISTSTPHPPAAMWAPAITPITTYTADCKRPERRHPHEHPADQGDPSHRGECEPVEEAALDVRRPGSSRC